MINYINVQLKHAITPNNTSRLYCVYKKLSNEYNYIPHCTQLKTISFCKISITTQSTISNSYEKTLVL